MQKGNIGERNIKKNILFICLFLSISLFLLIKYQLYDINKLRNIVGYNKIIAPIIFLILCTVRPLLLLPVGIFSTLGGLMFGAFLGTFYTLVGSIFGSIIAYFIAKKFGKDLVDRLLKGKYRKIKINPKENGFIITFILRVVPILPFDAVSYICGISNINFKDYLLGTIVGIIPGTFIYSYFGSSLKNIKSKQFYIAILLLLLLSLIPFIYKKYSTKIKGVEFEEDNGRLTKKIK
ncbi:MAG: TVP38/TMEM64 family protein [Caloramator sp.]|nr:TVP38/TMEM64 family protein [Caloramator sp.]